MNKLNYSYVLYLVLITFFVLLNVLPIVRIISSSIQLIGIRLKKWNKFCLLFEELFKNFLYNLHIYAMQPCANFWKHNLFLALEHALNNGSCSRLGTDQRIETFKLYLLNQIGNHLVGLEERWHHSADMYIPLIFQCQLNAQRSHVTKGTRLGTGVGGVIGKREKSYNRLYRSASISRREPKLTCSRADGYNVASVHLFHGGQKDEFGLE